MDPKAISADMKECQDRARAKHKEGFDKSGVKLELIMTPFISFHSNLPMITQKKLADDLEKCAGALQANLKTMRMLRIRPDTDDIYLFNNDKFLDTYVEKVWPNDAETAKKTGEILRANIFIKKKGKEQDENYVVNFFGNMQVLRATSGKAPHWLIEGFSAYCENKALGKNLIAHVPAAEVAKEKDNSGNWLAPIRSKAKDVKKWEELFQVQYADAKVLDSMASFSIVWYLVALDPMRFDKFIQNIADGENSVSAIEKAYGRKVAELQSNWIQWTQTQR
ncbi:MAG TPA: hypothetical protein VKX17_16870 [Planctomycetota bacterium]|nr:hypothetical protein [Planctomycetota bacterium]